MNTAATLYILQQIDTRLDRHEQRLSELDATIGDDSVVRVARAALDSVEAESQAARRAHHLIQEEIDTVNRKITSGEKRLYSGTVTNTKELQDLQDEGVSLKRRIVALEDRQLEAMIAQEDAETAAARGDEKADVRKTKKRSRPSYTPRRNTA